MPKHIYLTVQAWQFTTQNYHEVSDIVTR